MCPSWISFSFYSISLIISLIEVTSSYLGPNLFPTCCKMDSRVWLLDFGEPKSNPPPHSCFFDWLVSECTRVFFFTQACVSCNLALCFKRPFFQQYFLNQRREGHCQKTQALGKLEITEVHGAYFYFGAERKSFENSPGVESKLWITERFIACPNFSLELEECLFLGSWETRGESLKIFLLVIYSLE